MKNSATIKIKNLRNAIKKFKKAKDANSIIRLKVIIAYLSKKPSNKISTYFDISEKTVKRWIKSYESNGLDGLVDMPRSGRPPKLNQEQLDELKSLIEADQERVWVARHIYQLISTIFAVIYSVKYLPQLLKNIGLSFHKSMH